MVWSNLLSGFIGAVVGGLLALGGSLWATKELTAHERDLESDRELRLHRAAVRAVVLELINNLAVLHVVKNAPTRPALATLAYDSGILPLYARLPEGVAQIVSAGYGLARVWNAEPRAKPETAEDSLRPALEAIRGYAQRDLKLTFIGIDEAEFRARFAKRT